MQCVQASARARQAGQAHASSQEMCLDGVVDGWWMGVGLSWIRRKKEVHWQRHSSQRTSSDWPIIRGGDAVGFRVYLLSNGGWSASRRVLAIGKNNDLLTFCVTKWTQLRLAPPQGQGKGTSVLGVVGRKWRARREGGGSGTGRRPGV